MKTLKPMHITKPLGIQPRRFTEYRVRGFIAAVGKVKELEASWYSPFDAIRAALIWQGERHGLTLANAAKIPGMVLEQRRLLHLIPPYAGLSRGSAYLVSKNGEPIAMEVSSQSEAANEFCLNHPAVDRASLVKFVLFDNDIVVLKKETLGKFDATRDNLTFFNLSAFIGDVMRRVGLDPITDIYEPLTIKPVFWAKMQALPTLESQRICYETMQAGMAGALPWRAVLSIMERQGLDVSDLKGVFIKES